MGNLLRLGIAVLVLVPATLLAALTTPKVDDLQNWVEQEKGIAAHNMMANISPQGAATGAVVASPSQNNPNYFKHWVRDASITMNLIISFYENAQDANTKNHYYQQMMDFVDFSRQNQVTQNPSGGLGEPLFMPDGSAFTQGWGRPQNDGPAIRAFVLTRWAFDLLNVGQEDVVRAKLYDGKLPTYSVIKADLEYVSHNLDQSCFDLWEEVRGHHFYTRMVQRKALIDGANLADRLGDTGAANFYRSQVTSLEQQINSHWDSNSQIFATTLGRDGGLDYKSSGLDASTILAVMHGDTFDGFLPVYDDRAVSTAYHIEQAFHSLYPVNGQGPGMGIGRYPEDRYDGFSTSGQGNPWVLLTEGFSEYHYRVAKGLQAQGQLTISNINLPFYQDVAPDQASAITVGKVLRRGDAAFDAIIGDLYARGDSFMARTKYHTGNDGSLSEEMNRTTGFMQGAANLTWSDESLLVAAWERYGF